MNAGLEKIIRDVLTQYKKIAVVGLSPDPRRPSYQVTNYMIEEGYEITGVRPGGIRSILGRPCVESLDEVPPPLEIVDVFRASEFVPQLVEEVIRLKARVLWLQEGVSHPESEKLAKNHGLVVISNRCILREHARMIR